MLSGEDSPDLFSPEVLKPPTLGILSRKNNRFKTVGPQTHRLPFELMLRITLLTSAIMALINFVTIWVISFGVQAKFRTMEFVIDRAGLPFGIAAFVFICMSIASLCMYLVFRYAPTAGSSGAPENKGWLNGNDIDDVGKDYFSMKNLVVRQLATICANTAGYPVGREGPTVTMGSNVAYLVTHQMAKPYVEQMVGLKPKKSSVVAKDVEEGDQETTTALLLDEARLQHAQRIVCTVGGACGMSMLFDSPIGGIVYMFEEITSSSWPMELTMRAFVGTTVAALLSRLLLNLCGSSTHAFVVFEFNPEPDGWGWVDLPFFFLLGVLMGPFSAFHTRACLYVGVLRQQAMSKFSHTQPKARVIEAVVYIAICSLTCTLAALHAQCFPVPMGDELPEEGYVRYNCPENEYNPVASLILTTSEGAVKRLFSRRNIHQLHLANECLAFLAYSLMNVGLTGVPVPSGNFTGSMLIGGLAGRILGAFLSQIGVPGLAASGVYAMIGSAAMLCGFKQMCVAVVVFISHCANDLTLILPLMVTITVSLLLNRAINPKGFDEEQILRKKIPFLPGEPPEEMDMLQALELVDSLPEHAVLPPEARVSRVKKALQAQPATNVFPVVKALKASMLRPQDQYQVCLGFTTRDRLLAAVEAAKQFKKSSMIPEDKVEEEPDYFKRSFSRSIVERSFSDIYDFEGSPANSSDTLLPVFRLVDRSPYTLLEDMPAPRVYALFAKAGAQAACVVSERGKYLGTISKPGLIDKTRIIEEDLEGFKSRRPKWINSRLTRQPLATHAERDEENGIDDGVEEPAQEPSPHMLPAVSILAPATRNWSIASENQQLLAGYGDDDEAL